MNIVKLQNELKNVPDQALIGYVQNPTGQVPSYLALSELQRRKEMRDNYKAAKPEKSTVAQDLEQQAAPQPQAGLASLPAQQANPQAGVAGLPVPDQMFSGQGMAAGGIVAFDDGGEVKHFEQGGTSRLGDWWSSKMNQYSIDQQINDLMAEKNKYRFDVLGSYTPEQRATAEARAKEIDTQVANLKAQRSGAPVTPSAPPGPNVLGSQAAADRFTGLQYDPSQALNIKGPASDSKLPVASDGTNPYALEKVKGIGDYANDLKNYIGTDPMRAQLQERLSKMDTAAAKQAEQAPWMALAQAGFGMAAGKSPFALQNIAEGAGAGLKDYAAAKEKLNTLEEKRFSLLSDIAKQDRAETVAIAKYGADSKQAVEERNAKAKLQEAHDKVLMKMNTEDNNAKLAVLNAKSGLEAKDILKYKTEFRNSHPDYLAWQQDMINRKGKEVVNTPDFKRASELLLNQLIARDATLSTPASGSAKFLGFE